MSVVDRSRILEMAQNRLGRQLLLVEATYLSNATQGKTLEQSRQLVEKLIQKGLGKDVGQELRKLLPDLGTCRVFAVLIPPGHKTYRLALKELFELKLRGAALPRFGPCLCKDKSCVTQLVEKNGYNNIVGRNCGAIYGRIAPGEQTAEVYIVASRVEGGHSVLEFVDGEE